MPRNPDKTPCSVQGCRAWAIRGSDPPLCSPHRTRARREQSQPPSPEPSQPPSPDPGQPLEPEEDPFQYCRDCPNCYSPPPGSPGHLPWAESGGFPRGVGAPAGNQNRRTHGFYARHLDPQEQVALDDLAAGHALDAEIAMARIALRRVLDILFAGLSPGPEPTPLTTSDIVQLSNLAIRGTSAVSRLLRTRQALDLAAEKADRERPRCNIPCLMQLSMDAEEES